MNADGNAAVDIENDSNGEQFLTFMLDNEECGVKILDVQEIKGWMPVTPIPCTQDYVLGVVNLRGSIVPVIDLRLKFNLPQEEHTSKTAIIIVRTEINNQGRLMGLVVDEVSEVYSLKSSEVHESGANKSSIGGDYIRGLGVFEDKLVILINLDQVILSSLDELPEEVEDKGEADAD